MPVYRDCSRTCSQLTRLLAYTHMSEYLGGGVSEYLGGGSSEYLGGGSSV